MIKRSLWIAKLEVLVNRHRVHLSKTMVIEGTFRLVKLVILESRWSLKSGKILHSHLIPNVESWVHLMLRVNSGIIISLE